MYYDYICLIKMVNVYYFLWRPLKILSFLRFFQFPLQFIKRTFPFIAEQPFCNSFIDEIDSARDNLKWFVNEFRSLFVYLFKFWQLNYTNYKLIVCLETIQQTNEDGCSSIITSENKNKKKNVKLLWYCFS